jgi:hypothetical protein
MQYRRSGSTGYEEGERGMGGMGAGFSPTDTAKQGAATPDKHKWKMRRRHSVHSVHRPQATGNVERHNMPHAVSCLLDVQDVLS